MPPTPPPSASRSSSRFERLDALRGAAVLWMAAFHLSFDLNHFGLIARQNFYTDPFWTVQRACIVTLFVFCAGLGQAVALSSNGPRFTLGFWRRWAQIAGCAVLVSIGSWWMFPNSWISFGVLHCMAVMLVVLRLLQPLGRGLWLVGAVSVLLPWWAQHPVFDTRWTNGLGLVTHKPVTEDYAPLLPWFGVMCFGFGVGCWLLSASKPAASRQASRGGRGNSGAAQRFLERQQGSGMGRLFTGPLASGGLGLIGAGLAALGRWSLSFYMLHQPVFIGVLMVWLWWRR